MHYRFVPFTHHRAGGGERSETGNRIGFAHPGELTHGLRMIQGTGQRDLMGERHIAHRRHETHVAILFSIVRRTRCRCGIRRVTIVRNTVAVFVQGKAEFQIGGVLFAGALVYLWL